MADVKFWRCNHCGNIFYTVQDGGVTPVCCGEPMEELTAGSADAAQEKHVPQVKVDGCDVTVEVGSVHHPMSEEHSINWVWTCMTVIPGQKTRSSRSLLSLQEV